MTLYTGSIQNKPSDSDGTRISIMRFNRAYYEFDIWIPALAPSEGLLMGYKNGRIFWSEYELLFRQTVIEKNQGMIKILSNMALENIVTILCWEKTPEKCHRRLVAEACQKYNPALKIVLK